MPDLMDIDTENVARQLQEAHAVLGLDVKELHDDVEAAADLGDTNEEVELLEHEEEVSEDVILENVASALREFESSPAQDCEPTGAWRRYQRLIPSPARDLLSSCIRRDYVRDVVVDRIHIHVLLRGLDPDLLDAVSVRDAWRAACTPERLRDTLRLIRAVRDDVVRVLHKQGTFLHERSWTLPSYLKSWKPKNGILRVVETGRTNPTIGWSPFLEQTPPQLVRYVYETWLGSDVSGLDLGDSLGRVPVAFDLTGGSGTGFDFFSIVGCEVYATDLTSMNEAVGTLDARNFRALFGMRPVLCDKDRKQKPVRHPDLVLFDPGSRGYPAHSQIYDHVDGEPDEQDFAILDRHDWIDATTRIVKELLTVLAPGGVISFLIRCGVRDRGRVEPDLQLVQDAKAALGDDVCIIEEVVIEYGINRVKQASLAQARVPAVHLLLGRPA